MTTLVIPKIIFYLDDGEFWKICFADLYKCEDVKVITKVERFLISNHVMKKLCFLHNSTTLNSKFNLPLRSIWNCADNLVLAGNTGEKCFVFTDTSIREVTEAVLRKLKKSNNKLVIYFLNTIGRDSTTDYAVRLVKKGYFDAHFTIDANDAKKNKFNYCNCCYSKIDLNPVTNLFDLTFVGKNKGRITDIQNIARATQNVRSKYYVSEVKSSDMKIIDNVIYNQTLPYHAVLDLVNKSRAILEWVQDGQVGFSFRIYEAICYDKILITNNQFVKQCSFYNERSMIIIENSATDILSILENTENPKYGYSGEYSPIHLVKQIKNTLINNRCLGT